jgi:hypothetical protein
MVAMTIEVCASIVVEFLDAIQILIPDLAFL